MPECNPSLFQICHDIVESLDLTDDQKEHVIFMLAAYDALLGRWVFTYGKPLRTKLEQPIVFEDENALDRIRQNFPSDLRSWFDRILVALKTNNKDLLPPHLHSWYDRLKLQLLGLELKQ